MTPIPLSLYIHFPWCVKKCPYCDFNSHELKNSGKLNVLTGKGDKQTGFALEQEYIAALLSDLQTELPLIWGRSIESVFMGGGTPSLFSAEAMNQLLSGLRQLLPLRPATEITLEANPGTFEQERFSGYREAGINRLSIGIQSFDSDLLEKLGRIHGRKEALRAPQIARHAGFNNINLDLMFGLPRQSVEQALEDLHLALEFEPEHISWYQLTIEKNTLFHHQPPTLPDDDLIASIQEAGQSLLQRQGYRQYEVSAYARVSKQPGSLQCRHNVNYWQFGDYIGIGAGAHGKITLPDGNIRRHAKYRQPAEYMKQAAELEPCQSTQELTRQDRKFEFMLNALRLRDGFDATLFEQRTGLDFGEVSGQLNEAISQGLMLNENGVYRSSESGWLFLNDLMQRFLD